MRILLKRRGVFAFPRATVGAHGRQSVGNREVKLLMEPLPLPQLSGTAELGHLAAKVQALSIFFVSRSFGGALMTIHVGLPIDRP